MSAPGEGTQSAKYPIFTRHGRATGVTHLATAPWPPVPNLALHGVPEDVCAGARAACLRTKDPPDLPPVVSRPEWKLPKGVASAPA